MNETCNYPNLNCVTIELVEFDFQTFERKDLFERLAWMKKINNYIFCRAKKFLAVINFIEKKGAFLLKIAVLLVKIEKLNKKKIISQ